MVDDRNARLRWWEAACLKLRRLRVIQRRSVWCLTWAGWLCTLGITAVPLVWWCRRGESFLSSTDRVPAGVLVVEGWIGREGVRAAGQEFESQGYQYIVTAGSPTSAERWGEGGSNYAEMAANELMRSGVPKDKIIVAPARGTERQRTYESAVAVCQALGNRNLQSRSLDVFTWGTHARRTRLVFAKVYPSGSDVGVIGWVPSSRQAGSWWQSSERAKEFLTETVGYAYEALFNSGRGSNRSVQDDHPSDPAPPRQEALPHAQDLPRGVRANTTASGSG